MDYQYVRDTILNKSENGRNITLRDVQTIELEILLEIKRICIKSNIPFFLEGGTMLGAAIHKGFIPWDDDIDIAIEKEHYHNLIEALSKELDSTRFEFHCLENNRKHNITGPEIKVKRKGTYSPEPFNFVVNRSGMNGLFVDIFVYDKSTDDLKRIKFYRFQAKLSVVLQSGLMILGLHSRFIKRRHVNISERFSKKYPDSKLFGIRVINVYVKPNIFERDDYFPLSTLEFEGYDMPVARNYDRPLTIQYPRHKNYIPSKIDFRFRHLVPKKLKINEEILLAIDNKTLLPPIEK